MVDSFIRSRQRALTSISPHQANRSVIVPNRGFGRNPLRFTMFVEKDADLRGFTLNVGSVNLLNNILDGQELIELHGDVGTDDVELRYLAGAEGDLAAQTGYVLTDSTDNFAAETSLPWNGAQTQYKTFGDAARVARWDLASLTYITIQLEIIP